MAVTLKQLLNRALRITGEDEISADTTAVSDKTHLLYAEVANELKEEVEAAHNWRALWTTTTSLVSSGSNSFNVIGNESSRVVRIHEPHYGQLVPLVFDVTDSNPSRLIELDLAEMLRRQAMHPTETGDPVYFSMNSSAGGVPNMLLFPKLSSTRSIKYTLCTPQARLDAADEDDLATNIKVPVRPITMALVRYIYEERGEELGPNSRWSIEKQEEALRDLIALDAAEQGADSLVPV